ATFPAADLAALPDGPVTVDVTGGASLTMSKDTVAPGPPTSTPPPGRYLAAPLVTLAPPEPGARVRFTLDGSAPGLDSPLFGLPIHVTGNQTIRAFAVDAAGNPGPMVSLPYQLAPAAGDGPPGIPGPPDGTGTPPPENTPPTPRIGGITLAKRISMTRLRSRGLTATVELGSGTTAVRFTVYRRVLRRGHRRLKLVASIVRVPGHAGSYRVRLNARALSLTRPGLYRLKIVPGLSRATLDESATRTVWLRVVR
ncbi:MAG TPA: chitobiase/beta-hexosaminidase C-terminal domain-containing protein, partial [Solirubrobacteraceae bacterium]